MGLIKIQTVMNTELGKRCILSRPPEPPHQFVLNDLTSALYIGNTKIFGVPFTWSLYNVTNPHICVVGITGAGKSFFVKTFLLRASYIWNTNAVIIDWAGEYKAWVKQAGGIIVELGKGAYLNIMDLGGMRPLDRTKQIMTSLQILTDIAEFPEQMRLTEEAIEQTYLNAGFRLAERPDQNKDAPTLKNVIALLQERLQEGNYPYPAELENAIYRLRQFAREGEDFFARKSTIDIGSLTTSGLVDIDLSGLPDEKFRALASLFILQTLKERMRMEGWSSEKGIKTFVVLDEAWKVASDDRSDAITIIREGRKYQFGLIVASQNPTDINETIFSNVGTNIILRVRFERFLDYIQGSLNFSEFMRREISKFGVGQAAVNMSFQTNIQFPDTFLLNKVVGEVPLDTYSFNITSILSNDELASGTIEKEFIFEKPDLTAMFININFSTDIIDSIFKALDAKGREVDIKDLATTLLGIGVSKENITNLLRNFGMPDFLISRMFMQLGV